MKGATILMGFCGNSAALADPAPTEKNASVSALTQVTVFLLIFIFDIESHSEIRIEALCEIEIWLDIRVCPCLVFFLGQSDQHSPNMLGNVRMSACRRVACVGAQALLAGAGDGVLAERKKEPSGGGCGRSRGTRLGSSAASTNLPAPRFAY